MIKKESQFNAKVRLNMQIKSIEDDIENLKEELGCKQKDKQ